MHISASSSVTAAAALIMAVHASAGSAWGAWTTADSALATVTPYPGAPSSASLWPITVTSQYQPVSTCEPLTACLKGFCKTSYSCDEYAYVSTVIPCYDHSGPTSTTVTSTDAVVTVSNWVTTITSYVKPTGQFKWKGNPTPTPVYSTIAKEFCVPFNELGAGVIPDYEGSGLCGAACAPHDDGSRFQELDVVECHSGPKPYCVKYVETWVSAPVPQTTSAVTGFCSSYVSAPSAGTYTWTFPFTAPAPPAVTVGPSAWPYDPAPWFYEITKTCNEPTNWIITETVTKTVTYTAPASTKAPTSTWSVPFPTGPSGHPGFPGFPSGPPSGWPTPTGSPSGGATYIQVFDSGVKYHSSTPKYIGFSADDGIVVTDISSAALFTFENGALTSGGEYVGADSAWGYQAFQKYDGTPNVYSGWSQGGSSISWNFGSGSASFCVSGDNSLFISLSSSPSFACKPVDLSCGGPPPSSTTSSGWSSTTTSWAPDKSSDPDEVPVPVETEWSNVKYTNGGW